MRSVNDGGQRYLTRGAALAADYAQLKTLLNQPVNDKADNVKDIKHSLLLIVDVSMREAKLDKVSAEYSIKTFNVTL